MKVEFEAGLVRLRRAAASLATIQLGSQVVSFLARLLSHTECLASPDLQTLCVLDSAPIDGVPFVWMPQSCLKKQDQVCMRKDTAIQVNQLSVTTDGGSISSGKATVADLKKHIFAKHKEFLALEI